MLVEQGKHLAEDSMQHVREQGLYEEHVSKRLGRG